jgi:hypothetical protein
MHTVHRLSALRAPGRRSAQMLLALTMLASALAVTGARAEPAWAYTITRSPTEIVITSERLHDETVRATHTYRLRSNGYIIYQLDWHNSGRTRKYFNAHAVVTSPAIGLRAVRDVTCRRVPKDSYDSTSTSWFDSVLSQRWDEVLNDPNLSASFNLDAARTSHC